MKTKEQPNHHQEMLVALDEWWETRRQPTPPVNRRNWLLWLLPTPGNIIFTLLAIGGILWAQSVGAITLGTVTATTQSTGTIPYQGRLADAAGNPLTNTVNMSFHLYNAATGGAPLWTEQWTGSNGVQVSDGLFNVMLGSLTTIEQGVITGNSNLFLGITVGTDDEMTPRVQLGSVPYAVQALTVPDGSITTAKLAPDIDIRPEILSVEGVESVNLMNDNIWRDVPDLSVEFTSENSISIIANYQVAMRTGDTVSTSRHIVLRLVVNDTVIRTTRSLIGNTRYWSGSSTWMGTLSPGSHTIKVQYRTPAGGTNSPTGTDYSTRKLDVMIFGK